eukprot:TRINITY_DN66883_c0_g1_i1.p1 TRINITY_DN66883_c0_g1~~TRINITY_DN66883_c0_g1_i1.p1  ORF type:complete len:172 (+),score=20.69 TRINITY_DN66883_c0_g1_i1:42-518(+)
MADMAQVIATPFLMFNDQLESALKLYEEVFPASSCISATRDANGAVTSAEFTIGGQRFIGFNGGPHFQFSAAFSVSIMCEDQEEVDRYWGKLVEQGAVPGRCGWITDPFGLSFQIIPKRFRELMNDSNPAKVKAVVGAMMTMSKLEVAELERACAAVS